MRSQHWLVAAALLLAHPHAALAQKENPMVTLKTSMGTIVLELDAKKAPLSVSNFLQYVEDGHFDGTIFHRVIPGFMIQGGGFTAEMRQKPTREAIQNEAGNGLVNKVGTIAMARTAAVHSATAQFFINVNDNDFLNHAGEKNFGYAVFGRVQEGMDVVNAIAGVPTAVRAGHENVPSEPVVIESAARVKASE